MAQTLLVQDVMTRTPLTIDVGSSVAQARRAMKERQVRHLPVLDEGELVGLVDDRGLDALEAHAGLDTSDLPLSEAMTRAPFTVSPATPLEVAVRHMAHHRLTSAVVVEREKVVGLLTSNDGLRALAMVLAESRTAAPQLDR
jgi:acetoin utilization protein AcuB